MKKLLLFAVLAIFIIAAGLKLPYGIEAYKLEKVVAANTELNKKNIYSIPVLMYHHISTDETKWDSTCISPEKFREEMLYLKLMGYNTIHFKDYIAHEEQNIRLPDNPIIITFDDGYRSNYDYAFPILKAYDMKATIFMIGWSVGKELNKDSATPITPHFTWEQAKEMQQSGLVELQSHTFDLHNPQDEIHYGLGVAKLPQETIEQYKARLENDLTQFEKLMLENLESEIYAFSYPYGNHNEYAENTMKERGYRFTVTTKDGISDFQNSTYLIDRINMPSEIDSRSLISRLLLKQNKKDYLPYRTTEDYEQRVKRLENLYEIQRIYRNIGALAKH